MVAWGKMIHEKKTEAKKSRDTVPLKSSEGKLANVTSVLERSFNTTLRHKYAVHAVYIL